jgi:hypothetical protein
MQPRDTMRLYQTAARLWLTAALLSLALPVTALWDGGCHDTSRSASVVVLGLPVGPGEVSVFSERRRMREGP